VRIGAGFFLEAEPDFEGYGINLTNLIASPVFHFKDDQADIWIIQDEVRL
jgi:hypothetical protein